MIFKLKKRCVRCLKVLRDDGTCQYPKCCLYVAEPPKELSATDRCGKYNFGYVWYFGARGG